MMGVPDGWIVDVPGISRNEALKAAGNGVVPQQAAAALRDMLAFSHNKREQVKQTGNAVTPPAARDLISVGAASLGI